MLAGGGSAVKVPIGICRETPIGPGHTTNGGGGHIDAAALVRAGVGFLAGLSPLLQHHGQDIADAIGTAILKQRHHVVTAVEAAILPHP
ncbi:hypothetical protein D3C75_1082020 [compost metagenome]